MRKKAWRAVTRLVLHLSRTMLRPVEAISPRIYMRIYLWLLCLYGLKLTGTPRYISSRVRFDDIDLITLGQRSVLSEHVALLTHDYSFTTALIALGQKPPTDIARRRGITIGNNAFIGLRTIILPGTTVENDVIIGAGSVVRGTIKAGTIVVGNPSRVIGNINERASQWLAESDGSSLLID